MGRMQSETTRVSFSINENTLDDLDAIADAQDKSRSQLLRDLVENEVNEHVPDDNDEYRPSDDTLETIYASAVEHANQSLGLRFDLRKSQMASDTGIPGTAIRGHLLTLERHGYVKYQSGDALDSKKDYWRVKPLCANPKAWRYSKVYDPEFVQALETASSEDAFDHLESANPVRGPADD